MTTLYAQFEDATKVKIVGLFASPPIEGAFANTGSVETSDAAYKTYYDALPEDLKAQFPVPTTAEDDASLASANAATLAASEKAAAEAKAAQEAADAAAAAALLAQIAAAGKVTE